MREVQYQTPHGIHVSRVTAKLPLRKGLEPLPARSGPVSRHLSFFRIRIPRPLFALGHRRRSPAARAGQLPARGHFSPSERPRRRDQPHARRVSCGTIRIGTISAKTTERCTADSNPCPSCFPKRNAASSRRFSPSCARSPRNSATSTTTNSPSPARLASICCSSSSPFLCASTRDTRKDLQLFLCDDIIYMDRKREHIERFT